MPDLPIVKVTGLKYSSSKPTVGAFCRWNDLAAAIELGELLGLQIPSDIKMWAIEVDEFNRTKIDPSFGEEPTKEDLQEIANMYEAKKQAGETGTIIGIASSDRGMEKATSGL